LDLSIGLTDLSISQPYSHDDIVDSQPLHLVPLLKACGQNCPHEFSAFIESFPFDPIVQDYYGDGKSGNSCKATFQKIGEASYSEVFGIGDVVLKVIPIRDEHSQLDVTLDSEGPAPSDGKDVLKEMIVTDAMGGLCNGFVKLLRTYVVRGKYPSLLLSLWDEYNERKGSESIRPGYTPSLIFTPKCT